VDTLLWVLAIALILVGVAGVVLPALPGVVFVFGGIVLAAWIDGFERVGTASLIVIGVLGAIGFAVDWVATVVFAKRAGATRLGLLGAAIGTVLGIFAGLIGVFFLPLVGAAIGEYIAHRDALRAGQVGLATWIGLFAATIAKLAIVFTMIGVFVIAIVV
jgi:hypothetical protein